MNVFIMAAFVLLIFVLMQNLFARFVRRIARRILASKNAQMSTENFNLIARPLRYFCMSIGLFFAVHIIDIEGIIGVISAKITQTLIAATLFWSFYVSVVPLINMSQNWMKIFSAQVMGWLTPLLHWVIILIALASILQIWGVQILPIIAGFGLFGAVAALAAQDLLKNLLAGFSILAEKRFQTGDVICVPGVVEGTVEHIGFRSIRLRGYDTSIIAVPNNIFADNTVTNISLMKHRRIYWRIALKYQTSKKQLDIIQKNILAWLNDNDNFVSDPAACHVYIEGFNDSSIDMLIYCFIQSPGWSDWLAQRHELALAIKKIVEHAEAEFAFPSRALYVEAMPTELLRS